MNISSAPHLLRHLTLVGLAALLLVGVVGCSDDSNPTGPGGTTPPEEEEILTPRQVVIESIKISRFDKTKGETNWDATLNIDSRRPDIYVTMQLGTSSPIFRSRTVDNAHGHYLYNMSTSSAGVGLPKTVYANSQLTFSLYDEDDVSGDDFMGAISFRILGKYKDDNAETFSWVLSGSGDTVFRVTGRWVY